MILIVKGSIPNKKDRLRPRKGGGMYYEDSDRGALDAIVLQLRAQWKGPPLECAKVIVYLYRKSARFDPDGQKATILDALKQAGVVVDDNAARVPDSRVIACAVDDKSEETTEVQVYGESSPWPQRIVSVAERKRRTYNRKAREILKRVSKAEQR